MTSLLGIRVLCKAGCKVVFTDAMCQVIYKGKIILTGYKDQKSDLWTLPIFQAAEPATPLPVSDSVFSTRIVSDKNVQVHFPTKS